MPGRTSRHDLHALRPRLPRNCLAGAVAVPAAARAVLRRAGPAADLADHLRGRLPRRARDLDHSALRDLHHLRRLHHAGPARHDPAVSGHAELAVDGLRPGDGLHARAADDAAAALVPAHLASVRRRARLAVPGLCLLARGLFLRCGATPVGLSGGAAGLDPDRHDVRGTRYAAVLHHQAARELRRDHELRDLPDVLRLLGALSLMEDA